MFVFDEAKDVPETVWQKLLQQRIVMPTALMDGTSMPRPDTDAGESSSSMGTEDALFAAATHLENAAAEYEKALGFMRTMSTELGEARALCSALLAMTWSPSSPAEPATSSSTKAAGESSERSSNSDCRQLLANCDCAKPKCICSQWFLSTFSHHKTNCPVMWA